MLLANLNAGLAGASPRLLSKYSAAADVFLRISDMIVVLGAALIAYRLRSGSWMPGADYRLVIGTSLLFAVICFNALPLYRSWRGLGLLREIAVLGAAWGGTFALFSIYALILKVGHEVSRLWVGMWFAGGFVLLALSRTLVRSLLHGLRSHGVDVQRIVVVGLRPPVVRIQRYLRQNPWVGMRLLGYFRTRDDMAVGESSEMTCLGELRDLPAFLAEESVEEVWVSMPLDKLSRIKPLLSQLEHTPIKIKLIPDLVEISMLNQAGEQLGNVPVISLRQGSVGRESQFLVFKAVVDRCLAFVALLGLAPVMIAIAIAVKLDSPGPVFFRQRRQGRAGREFQMLKFRSMRMHREGEHQVTQATRQDPRVTRVGAFLRRTSLDELPQLFNVLGGSMSLVGPRPHAIPHNRHYQALINCYAQRHYVKPGITGWAQVNGFRGETPMLRDMRKRVQYDLDYIRRWSLWFDIKIMAMTLVKVLGQKGAY
ncbi:undecaprenyl-phosphate glucose phosphotransferase [Lysobacter sp. M2-1]|uniref:undecaprenyl-phosphate glucose phosphotransferase n=1 Tax=Lysobacter sp. M2-1 TaxID=2916839 RepID=UPI001F5A495F|nr:undecaprenyl-phosphate glucose phosphotransferase [Lysobacter sp. M2-1]